MVRPLLPPRGSPKLLASYAMIVSCSRWPTRKTHGHMWMSSTPGVGYYSRRCRIFPPWRQMHGNMLRRAQIGLRHLPRPSDRQREGMDVCGWVSAFVCCLARRLNQRTGNKRVMGPDLQYTEAHKLRVGSLVFEGFRNLICVS